MPRKLSASRWTSITVCLGDPDVAPERRQAYVDAAGEAGSNSLSQWVRLCLDSAARYAEPLKQVPPAKNEGQGPTNATPQA